MRDIFGRIKDGVITAAIYVSLTVIGLVGYGLQFAVLQRAAQAELESKQKAEESAFETVEESQETEDFFETTL